MTGYARSTDPESSHEAAGGIDATRLQMLVVQALSETKVPMTSIDIAKHLGIHLVSISPRMKPLENLGQIVCVGTLPALNSNGRIRNLRHYVIKDGRE
jgi:predicted ArsR family transcriptional regulator